MTTAPGPRMRLIAEYIAEHPGCNKLEAGRCGTDRTVPYAGSVNSLIRGGYVHAHQDHRGGWYRLFLTRKGADLAAEEILRNYKVDPHPLLNQILADGNYEIVGGTEDERAFIREMLTREPEPKPMARLLDHTGHWTPPFPVTDVITCRGTDDQWDHKLFGSSQVHPGDNTFQAMTFCGKRALQVPGHGSEVNCPHCLDDTPESEGEADGQG